MLKDYTDSTEEEIEEALRAVLQHREKIEDTIFDEAEAETFGEAGVLTMNRGLVVRLQDGSEYQLMIVRSR